MEFFQRLWNSVAGPKQSVAALSDSIQEIAPAKQNSQSEIELVPAGNSDPYQDHTNQPHCSDHFLFTKDCALYQEIMHAQPPQARPASRSFGFTDNVTTASLTPSLGNVGPTAANAALQSLPDMMLKAEVPHRPLSERLVVNSLVEDIVDAVAKIEIDNMGNN